MRRSVKEVLGGTEAAKGLTVQGWVRTRRDSRDFSFLEINDGTCLGSLQVIADAGIEGYDQVQSMTTGASVRVVGNLVSSPGKGQKWEMQATSVELVGTAPEDYPLQKKRHGPEFLREMAHLRPRTNLFGAVFRTRSRLAHAVHRFFEERNFVYVHTPIITANDCEGAGEMFQVTTQPDGGSDQEDFFGKTTHLTVSGQLEGETFACALTNIYTFGPTFRAENSHTSRHASEFWMIEPEMAFCNLEGDMDLAEEFVKELTREILEGPNDDFGLFSRFVDKGLEERLRCIVDRPFARLSYTEAVEILEKSGQSFDYPVGWGENLQSEHERYLTEEHCKSPVTVYDYPEAIKPFYMRRNDDGKTVAAMDVLVPGIGEIVGGSQREERLEALRKTMSKEGLSEEAYGWYLDLRRFGTVPHAGFGLGFERMLMMVTGVQNIRDVIPYPRTPGVCGP
ncbi:MAG TPA: asparagine--tRNA ligase [Verrucomicrobiales bacterium]|nr:asparagine--tRNA ligase [Verrucomicrobiales bacterium]